MNLDYNKNREVMLYTWEVRGRDEGHEETQVHILGFWYWAYHLVMASQL